MEPVVKLTRIKVYKCNRCSKAFINEETLEKHSKLHISKFSDTHESKRALNSLDLNASLNGKSKVLRSSILGTSQSNVFKYNKRNREKLNDLQIQIKHAYSILEEEPEKENKESTKNVIKSYKSGLEGKSLGLAENTLKTKTKPARKLKKNYSVCEPIENNDGTFSCTKCSKSFSKEKYAVEHYKRFHLVNTCEHCNISFEGKYAFDCHVNKEHTKKYVCPHCQKAFGANGFLKLHIHSHLEKNERPYVCTICDKRFTQTASLKAHFKRMHVRLNDHICRFCKKSFPERGAVVLHERTHTGQKPYECKYCKKAFSDPSAYQRHIRTHTKDLRYACPECPMKFSDASGLIAHKRRHAGIKDYACHICAKKFYDYGSMKVHHDAIHTRIRNYECDHCAKRFANRTNIQTHIFTVHRRLYGHGKMFECHYCGKKCATKAYLLRHIYANHGDEFGKSPKRVQCRVCGEMYRNIKCHIRMVHKRVKRFECNFCGEKYHLKDKLARHIYTCHRVEAGLKKVVFKCRQCKKKYKSSEGLHYHKKSAHGVVLYCNLCNNMFYSAEGLETHKKRSCKKKLNLGDFKRDFLDRYIGNAHNSKELSGLILNIEGIDTHEKLSEKEKENLGDSQKTDLLTRHNKNEHRSKDCSESIFKVEGIVTQNIRSCKKEDNLEDSLKTDNLEYHTENMPKSIVLRCNVCAEQFAATQLRIDKHKNLCQGILIIKEEPMEQEEI